MVRDIKAGEWRRPAVIALVLAGIAMAVLLFLVGRWLTFWFDEWDFLFGRQNGGLQDFLRPHVDGFVLVPALVYYILVHAFGLASYFPFLLVTWTAHFACVCLLAHIVNRRSGVVVGVMAGLSLLFLGTAFEVLLQPFQMQYLFAAAGGLLAIDVLDREPRRRWQLSVAVVALLVAIASSGVGPIMVGLIALWSVLRRDRGAFVVAATPLMAYGIWYLAWYSHLARVEGTAANLGQVPVQLAFGVGAAIAGTLGLPPERFAWVGFVVGIALVGVALWRGLRPGPLAIAATVALVTEYGLQAVLRGAMGTEHGARSGYIYPAAIFIWLTIAGWIGRRLDPPRWVGGRRLAVPALVGLMVVPMALGGMLQFVGAARASRELRATELRELALMTRLRASPDLAMDVSPDPAMMPQVTAGQYFAAIDRFGTPEVAASRPADDLPGPDAASLNVVALRLLGHAIAVGPAGHPAALTPDLVVARGVASPGDAPGCTMLRTASGEADATWSPPASGVAIRTEGQGEAHAFLGLYEPVDQRMDPAMEAALQRGETIWLPRLPPFLVWTTRVKLSGDAMIHVCSREVP
jgi:hypothetical protein